MTNNLIFLKKLLELFLLTTLLFSCSKSSETSSSASGDSCGLDEATTTYLKV